MPLVRVAGTPEPDVRPEFWRNWRQLGHAVVTRAICDYARAKRKAPKDQDGFNYAKELGYYEKFFCSRYFSYICPDYDGVKLLEILESGGWKTVRTAGHYTHSPTYKPKYIPKALRGQHGKI